MYLQLGLLFLMLSFIGLCGCHRAAEADENDSQRDSNTDSSTDTNSSPPETDSGLKSTDSGHNDTSSDSHRDSDTVSDTDSHVDTVETDSETETDTDILSCFSLYVGECECMGECEDGFGYIMFHGDTDDIGEDNWISPSEQLQDAGIAWGFCSVCGGCSHWFRIKDEYGEWQDVQPAEFCRTIVDAQQQCDGCIVVTGGGGG